MNEILMEAMQEMAWLALATVGLLLAFGGLIIALNSARIADWRANKAYAELAKQNKDGPDDD